MILRRIRAFLIWAMILLISFLIALYGAISAPVMAYTYVDIWQDFRDYEVADFSSVDIMLNKDTFGMSVYGWSSIGFRADFSSCPSAAKTFMLLTLILDSNSVEIFGASKIIRVPCSLNGDFTIYDHYFTLSPTAQQIVKNTIVEDNGKGLHIYTNLLDIYDDVIYNDVGIELKGLEASTVFYYEFNTTYYFDHLAVDLRPTYFASSNITINNVVGEADARAYLLAAYDSNNFYRIRNSDLTMNTARSRKKYHVPLGQMVTAYGIGVGTYALAPFHSASYTKMTGQNNNINFRTDLYMLNYSNTQHSFPGATMPTLEYQTCNAWDIPCHLGNALVYIGKDLPITSDIYSILSRAWQVVSNGMYAISGIFGAVFNSGGLVSGNFFGIALMVAFGIGLTTMIITGGDDDD